MPVSLAQRATVLTLCMFIWWRNVKELPKLVWNVLLQYIQGPEKDEVPYPKPFLQFVCEWHQIKQMCTWICFSPEFTPSTHQWASGWLCCWLTDYLWTTFGGYFITGPCCCRDALSQSFNHHNLWLSKVSDPFSFHQWINTKNWLFPRCPHVSHPLAVPL